jgi:hypothetical protein
VEGQKNEKIVQRSTQWRRILPQNSAVATDSAAEPGPLGEDATHLQGWLTTASESERRLGGARTVAPRVPLSVMSAQASILPLTPHCHGDIGPTVTVTMPSMPTISTRQLRPVSAHAAHRDLPDGPVRGPRQSCTHLRASASESSESPHSSIESRWQDLTAGAVSFSAL